MCEESASQDVASGPHIYLLWPFFILGKACGKKDCKNRDGVRKKHMGLHRMSDEHCCMQIAHVETNKDNLAFNKMCVRNLPEDKKYLLQMPEGEN